MGLSRRSRFITQLSHRISARGEVPLVFLSPHTRLHEDNANAIMSRPQIIPNLFQWTTFPITSLLDAVWSQYERQLDNEPDIDPHVIETVSILERSINYAHTGAARVLTRGLMDVSWLSLGIIFDGLPTLSKHFASHPGLVSGSLTLLPESWPVYTSNNRPLTSSRRVQLCNYGERHYEVSPFDQTTMWHT